MKNSLIIVALFAFFYSCTSGDEKQVEGVLKSETYTLTPFEQSEEYKDASIEEMTYTDSTFRFTLGNSSYTLGEQTPDAPQKSCANSAEGQHIHLIVGKSPYIAKYEAEFDHVLPDGDHQILAFLSRSYHESIKNDKAYKAVNATVVNGAFDTLTPIEEPTLFYSRPKGMYEGEDTEKVMLDYFLVNCEEGDYSVLAEINGEEFTLEGWQPYYIEGLPAGESEIKLTLLDKDGNRVDNSLNGVTRKIKLAPTPQENN